ncbi:NifZ family protein [Zymomonas mobilis subsp. mobilis ZM4 = ATCC 31821]|uniref:NifZ family protein n=1 Tax=Zymomonas mobilis subsp. mobilis (strain ATCC 31821 / ZM4 / CP4) TaxID=264203 RepID=Q5NLG7_ZYMMO|nr:MULTISPECIES: nitrogen fixation protein NifZ [Zymomonas]AAV90443.1 NifZ family protein [Zymomonas mobilis subsp. mobilis ZM4 = ATCC 31821]ACV75954.1 NifZ family protein [Zymomonas mobilis subsp. mobilis NCIMB 11163]AFN57183.1 NifZ family protein [Zymomonas mobilis subsp. mobilis ATCC 29191]AHB10642.1 NifZ domain-containing protein [Zymomonas mobilis subsp. mobilis str. CP4 = NRRL B-14023]AHJ70954.1 NifZ domain protein [Zymomonas mobilis subsp. mobilis NRRL B-12526]
MNDENEIQKAPVFPVGTKVKSRLHIKNDGTFIGADIGEILINKGDVGYIRDIGVFLQRYYIYAVDFVERGKIVGMRKRELDIAL